MSAISQLDESKTASKGVVNMDSTSPGTVALEEIKRLIEKLQNKRDRQKTLVDELERQLSSAITTFELMSKGKSPSVGLSISFTELQGKTQLEALVAIATANHKKLIVRKARRLLIRAGLIKNEKNASGAIFTAITRSGRFERESPGVYKLIEKPTNHEGTPSLLTVAG